MPTPRQQFAPYFNTLKQLFENTRSGNWLRESALLRHLVSNRDVSRLQGELTSLFNKIADAAIKTDRAEAWEGMTKLLELAAQHDGDIKAELERVKLITDRLVKNKALCELFMQPKFIQFYTAKLEEFLKKPMTVDQRIKQITDAGLEEYGQQIQQARRNAAYEPWDRLFYRFFAILSQLEQIALLKMGFGNPDLQNNPSDNGEEPGQMFGYDPKTGQMRRQVRPSDF